MSTRGPRTSPSRSRWTGLRSSSGNADHPGRREPRDRDPRFCDHPFLDPIGACRQCYVEIEGQRKLFTSCTTEVAPGMVVRTQNTSDDAHRAQVANLEFLLLNHPLDCPICDRGGECPLQDQAMAFGPGESRYTEPKRTYEKPIALAARQARSRAVRLVRALHPLLRRDQRRPVHRAVRAGRRRTRLDRRGRGLPVAVLGQHGADLSRGALTAEPYRFVARPFDLTTTDSVCQHCSAGCNVRVDLRRGSVVRVLARDNADVNDAWTCDKGRFAFRHADLPGRVTMPLIRDRGLEPASFDEVFAAIAEWSHDGRVAFLSGAASRTRTRTRSPSSRGWRSRPTTWITAGRSTAATRSCWPRRRRSARPTATWSARR